jgi:outer membrane protein OmpA-like peptidoglycan-associated protein
VRAYFGAAFSNTPPTQPPCIEGKPYRLADCPELDRDGDGVKNGVDAAPEAAEDPDGYQDEDGAPDVDDDGDGVPDADDRCPRRAGPPGNDGCPDEDADGDGVVDRLDGCPKDAEDLDGFEDSDGCPDPDDDGDGLADPADACPLQAGIPQEKGCPAKDADGDGVFDHEDNCPQDAGEKANAGCPAAQKQLVVITATALKILDRVSFDDGRATIQKRSNALLDNVARVLIAHPELPRVRVEVHADEAGRPEKNKALSQARADAVKAYLVNKGVAPERLDAVGLGDTGPVQPKDTRGGREANRRVEFNLERP